MPTLQAWREIARPHKDVLEGTFKQSEFAADLTAVATGRATEEYQDAEKFFSRTFITEGMKLLLGSVAQRMTGKGGDPVIQLQTSFGGGKTHTLLAVYHLAKNKGKTANLEGIPSVLDAAGVNNLPTARISVVDGIGLSVSQPSQRGNLQIRTLWGHIAYELYGQQGYELVAESDRDGTSPDKNTLQQLLEKAAPCVILMDEVLAFIRQLEDGKSYSAGTYASNITFIQALTEAMKQVPNAMLLASLPESELELGGSSGQRTLNALEKYFARVESVWKPVGTEESFEIVRRRLFENIGDESKRKFVCQAFADMYQTQSEEFPQDTHSARYLERLQNSYPIHPEIFDRLYEDWSTLEKFQRTRGVLQYMAVVIHRLWNSENKDLLIMPGSLPLFDGTVRDKSIHYLPQGWEPILEREIDGERAEAYEVDSKEPRFGAIQAARRVARTIFLGSAPSVDAQQARGIHYRRVNLGVVQPDQTIGIFEDVLKRLRDRLHYLYSDQERYWFDTRPNLRREMEERKRQFESDDHLLPLLRKEIEGLFKKTPTFAGVHTFAHSGDIPDDLTDGVRLAILSPNQPYGKSDPHLFERPAEEILRNRGNQPRLRQNRLVFLAAEYETINRLKDQARTYLAWKSIVTDVERMSLNLGVFQAQQARDSQESELKSLRRMILESYRHVVVPSETRKRDGSMQLSWENIQIPTGSANVMQSIESKLVEEEWLTKEWAPLFLKKLLVQWYFRDDAIEVGAQRVWQDMGNYLYMPRLVSEQVFRNTLAKGVETEDYFAVADGKDGERYLGFAFGRNTSIQLNGDTLIIEAEVAKKYAQPAPTPDPDPNPDPDPDPWPPPPPPRSLPKRFYGNVELAPISAKLDFATIVDEVLEQFTSRVGTQVKITIEIEAESDEGFGENQQRAVRENCGMLRFTNAEFPE